MKQKIIDIFMLLISFIGAALTGAAIIDDSLLSGWVSSPEAKRQPIGFIRIIKSDVRRKMKSSFVWEAVKKQTEVFDRDSVFTGVQSNAEIELYNGMVLKLKENSLVTIDVDKLGLSLDLRLGELTTDFVDQQKIKLLSDGKETELSGDGALRISRGKLDLTVKSESNNNVALSIDGVSKMLSATEILKIGKKVRSESLDFLLLSPINEQILWGDEYRIVDLNWSSSKKIEGLLVVAQDKNFKNIVYKKRVNSLSGKERVKLFWPENTYYWRILSKDKSVENATVEKFVVAHQVPPKLIFPASDMEFLLNEKVSSTMELRLKWEEKISIEKYKLQLATDSLFEDIIEDEVLEEKFIDVKLGLGNYYWRVAALGVTPINKVWSSATKFSVIEKWRKFKGVPLGQFVGPPVDHYLPYLKKTSAIEVVKTDTNELDKTVRLKVLPVLSRTPASLNNAIQNPPVLNWSAMSYAKAYQLEISKDENFKSIVFKELQKRNSFTWRSVRTGDYFWRVRKVDSVGVYGQFGEINKLKVELEAPQFKDNLVKREFSTRDVLAYDKAKARVLFVWKENPLASSYELEWSGERGFSNSKKQKITSSRIEMDLLINKKEKRFLFRVAALDKTGRRISDYSRLSKVKLKKELVLKRPVLSIPSNNSTVLTLNGPTPPVLFLWNKSENAKKYQFQVSEKEDFSGSKFEKEMIETQILMNGSIVKGANYWRVRGIYKDFVSPWSKARRFNVN